MAQNPGPFADDNDRLANTLGWRWSAAHNGYINEGHRKRAQAGGLPSWGDYEVAEDVSEALFWDGIETDEDLRSAIAKAEGRDQ